MIRTNTENRKSIELNMWIKACKHFPTCAKPGQPLKSPTNCAEDSSPTDGWGNSVFVVAWHVAKATSLVLSFPHADVLHERMRTQVFFFFHKHVAMVEENCRTESWLESWCSEGAREDQEMCQRLTPQNLLKEQTSKKEKPWLTPTESCEPDESNVEEMKPFKALPAGPLAEDTWIREPMHGCQTGVTSNKGSHLHPRHNQ